ncbi:MAG: sigma-70 family RNA polymerase sigma factor [Victivallaceae bacterium]|nr:sigma-70 family RNA polymerase sigma factor [Victivallaceae bacterium]
MTIPETQFKTVFSDMVREKLPLYRSIAIGIVNSRADADDAVQSALLKGWRKRAAFKSDIAALSGWVARIVVSESYDQLRRRRKSSLMLEQFDPDNAGGRRDQREFARLDAAIEKLPELYRETVHIALFSKMTTNEAAATLDCSPNTLYQRLHKAKTLLKKHLRSRDDDE